MYLCFHSNSSPLLPLQRCSSNPACHSLLERRAREHREAFLLLAQDCTLQYSECFGLDIEKGRGTQARQQGGPSVSHLVISLGFESQTSRPPQ